MALSLHVDPSVDAYSPQFHHLNSPVASEAVNIAYLTATSADSINELGITDDDASTHLKYCNSTILKLPKIFQTFIIENGCDFWNFRK